PGCAAHKCHIDKAAKHHFLCHRRDKDRPDNQRRADMPCDLHRELIEIRIEKEKQSRAGCRSQAEGLSTNRLERELCSNWKTAHHPCQAEEQNSREQHDPPLAHAPRYNSRAPHKQPHHRQPTLVLCHRPSPATLTLNLAVWSLL